MPRIPDHRLPPRRQGRGRPLPRSRIAVAALARAAVVAACASSAGIHAALTPGHFGEGTGAGLGFLGATILLAALTVALTLRPSSLAPLAGVAVVLAGLLGVYGFATTTGLPGVHAASEPIDGLALATKAIEATGLLATAHLLCRDRLALAALLPLPKGQLT